MARIAAIASLVIVGVIVADLIANPKGVKAASSGVTGIETPALNALLGVPSR